MTRSFYGTARMVAVIGAFVFGCVVSGVASAQTGDTSKSVAKNGAKAKIKQSTQKPQFVWFTKRPAVAVTRKPAGAIAAAPRATGQPRAVSSTRPQVAKLLRPTVATNTRNDTAVFQATTPATIAASQTPTARPTTPTAAQVSGDVPNPPRVPTPPTPLTKETPTTAQLGISDKNEPATNVFDRDARLPGQPQAGDANEITTLEQALGIAFARNPQILLAVERAYRADKNVASINAGARPQIAASLTYSRLLNQQSGFGGGAAGGGLSSQTSPYQVGLQSPAPGQQSVTLSGGSASTGSVGATPAGGQSQTGAAATANTATTRAASTSGGEGFAPANSGGGGRQATGDTDGQTTTGATDGGTTSGSGTAGTTTSGGGFGGGGSTPLNQSRAGISLSQAVDINGLIKDTRQLGDIERALSRLEVARTRQEVALNVRNGFYSVLRAQAFVRVNEAAVAQSEEQLRVTRAQLDAGVAAEFDVLRTRTQLENNRQALITSRNQVNVARNALANLIGIDPGTPVNAVVPTIPALPDLDEARLVAVALRQRAEILQADANIIKAQKNIRLSRRGLLPTLDIVANGTYNITQQNFGNEKITGSVGLQFALPLNDGGATRANVRAAVSDERGALIQKDQFVRGVKSEVQQSIIAVRDASERSAVTQATVLQAREALRLANVRFRAGVGTQLEINDSQTALTQAETNNVNAQYDYLGALARLSRSLGNPE